MRGWRDERVEGVRGWRDERVEVGVRCRDRVKKGTKV